MPIIICLIPKRIAFMNKYNAYKEGSFSLRYSTDVKINNRNINPRVYIVTKLII